MSVFEHTSYRSFLKAALAERMGRNDSYSLRAFGRDLDLDPAHLSGVFKGRKGISPQKAMEIAARLGLDAKASDYLCLLVQIEQAKTPELKQNLFRRMNELNGLQRTADLSLELFQAISDWHHIAIIEMTELDDFELTGESAAHRLGISRVEAEVAIERLERLELIDRDDSGHYRKAHVHGLFQTPYANKALRTFHRQMLEKASKALEEQPPAERYVGSDTFSIDVTQLEEARGLIDEFRRKMIRLFDRGKKKTETYHFIVELFRLTRKNEESPPDSKAPRNTKGTGK